MTPLLYHPSTDPRRRHSSLPLMNTRNDAKSQRGFTLIEMLIAVIVTGILLSIWAAGKGDAHNAFDTAREADQEAINKRLASVLLDYAGTATISPTGDLPAPSTGMYSSAIPYAITALQALLVEARIRPSDAASDGSAAKNLRAYQTVTGQVITVPLYGTFGPVMTLSYTEASLHSTYCAQADACNAGVPGKSGTLTALNLNSYGVLSGDYGLTRFSTLAIQKQKLAQTADNIETIRNRMQELFRERQRTANANDTTNFYPHEINALGATGGKTANCNNEGWFSLSTSDILPQVGLDPAVNGKTAWGGDIQYCPDYDALAPAPWTPNSPPHFAALRLSTNPSTGSSPAYANNAGSTIIPF